MKTFLRFVGAVELLAYLVGVVMLAINLKSQAATIFYFVLYVIFAPTIGVLCLCVASLLEIKDYQNSRIAVLEKKLGIKTVPIDVSKEAGQNDVCYVVAKDEIVDSSGHSIKKGTKGILLSREGITARVRFEGNGKVISYVETSEIEDVKE